MRYILLLAGFLCASGGIFYFFFLSDHFELKHIEVSGVATLPKEKILEELNAFFARKKFGILSLQNYFLFSGKDFTALLGGAFPKISEITVRKIEPATLKIAIQERDAVGVWCLAARELEQSGKSCFYLDRGGVIFESAPTSVGSLILAIFDLRPIEARIGDKIFQTEEMVILGKIQGVVSRNFPFDVRAFFVKQTGEFEILTSEAWKILLAKNENIDDQLSNLKYLLEEKIKNHRKELEYVDLRLGNRLYYKYQSATSTSEN